MSIFWVQFRVDEDARRTDPASGFPCLALVALAAQSDPAEGRSMVCFRANIRIDEVEIESQDVIQDSLHSFQSGRYAPGRGR